MIYQQTFDNNLTIKNIFFFLNALTHITLFLVLMLQLKSCFRAAGERFPSHIPICYRIHATDMPELIFFSTIL